MLPLVLLLLLLLLLSDRGRAGLPRPAYPCPGPFVPDWSPYRSPAALPVPRPLCAALPRRTACLRVSPSPFLSLSFSLSPPTQCGAPRPADGGASRVASRRLLSAPPPPLRLALPRPRKRPPRSGPAPHRHCARSPCLVPSPPCPPLSSEAPRLSVCPCLSGCAASCSSIAPPPLPTPRPQPGAERQSSRPALMRRRLVHNPPTPRYALPISPRPKITGEKSDPRPLENSFGEGVGRVILIIIFAGES